MTRQRVRDEKGVKWGIKNDLESTKEDHRSQWVKKKRGKGGGE